MSAIDHTVGMPATWTALGFALQWMRQFPRFGDRELFPAAVILAFLGAIPWHHQEGLSHIAMCAIAGVPAVLGGTFIGDRVSRAPHSGVPKSKDRVREHSHA